VFDSAGPNATQLKTRFKSFASRAINPASRWIATAAKAIAPPVSRPETASAARCCVITGSAAPQSAKPIDQVTGRWNPWRSATRPAHNDKPIGAKPYKLSSAPTIHAG